MYGWHRKAAAERRAAAAAAACLAEEMREASVYWCSPALQGRSRALEKRCDDLAVAMGANAGAHTIHVRRSQWEAEYRDAAPSTPGTPITNATLEAYKKTAIAVAAAASRKLRALERAVKENLEQRDVELRVFVGEGSAAPAGPSRRPPPRRYSECAACEAPQGEAPESGAPDEATRPKGKKLPRVPFEAVWHLVGCPYGHRDRRTRLEQSERTYTRVPRRRPGEL